ncbi:MAG: hypothetical protein GF393_09380 [Armatimonadia bacterium]|nr:hypothetical protein [Armatimonadia bacterium]
MSHAALCSVTLIMLAMTFAMAEPVAVPGATGHPTYLTHSYSHALVADGEDVYIAYLSNDEKSSSHVVKLDGSTGRWSSPVRIGGGERRDAHYYPNLVMDAEGYLHVFYGSHCDPLRYRRSSRPRDISAWDRETHPVSIATYPRPFVLADGRIIVFMRSGRERRGPYRYGWVATKDGGVTWSRFHTLIDVPDNAWIPYVGGVAVEEKPSGALIAHIAWSWFDYARNEYPSRYEDVLYAAFSLGAHEWSSTEGGPRPLPATHATVPPIRRGDDMSVADITVNRFGQPTVLFSESRIEGEATRTLIAEFDGFWRIKEPIPDVHLPPSGMRMTLANGWTTIIGRGSADVGFVIAQRRDPSGAFVLRQVAGGLDRVPVHPVIVPDSSRELFHIAWTGYSAEAPGQLMYTAMPVEPPESAGGGRARGE